MSYEMTVGLLVVDTATYAEYRDEIAPLLRADSGGFRFDFEISRTLKTEADHDINRLFVLRFPDRAAKVLFLRIRNTWRSAPVCLKEQCRE